MSSIPLIWFSSLIGATQSQLHYWVAEAVVGGGYWEKTKWYVIRASAVFNRKSAAYKVASRIIYAGEVKERSLLLQHWNAFILIC